jgi:hypothetical protein
VKLKCEDGKVGSSEELRAHILDLISHCEIVIAEVSTENANVLYEAGFAKGIGKPVILVARRGSRIPADVQGLKRVEYSDLGLGFDAALAAQLKFEIEINSRIAVLRDMLEGPTGQPVYILASPMYPAPGVKSVVQYFDTRTFGDNLGVLGLISAFASMWGPGNGVELISAKYSPPKLLADRQFSVNLYLIGSPKVNPHTAEALEKLQHGEPKLWSFGRSNQRAADGHRPWVLYRNTHGTPVPLPSTDTPSETGLGKVLHEGYGLVMRGPHPSFPEERMVTILAGGRSIGTGAACLAATHPRLVQQIRSKLPHHTELSDKGCTFWALVRGRYSDPKKLLQPENVEVEEVGVFKKLRP